MIKSVSGLAQVFRQAAKNYLTDGIILILLGIAMLIWPQTSLKVLCVLIGAVLVCMGALRTASFFSNRGNDRKAEDLISGAIMLVLGLAFIFRSTFFIGAFQFVTGILLLYGAFLMLTQAWMLRGQKGKLFTLSMVFGIATAVLAVIILLNPVAFASFITQLHGISLIVEGLSMVLVLRDIKAKR